MQHIPDPVAHVVTVSSVIGWLASVATSAQPIVSVLSGIASIIGVSFAVAWYWRRLRD